MFNMEEMPFICKNEHIIQDDVRQDEQRKVTDIESVMGPSQRHIPITNLVPYVRLERVTLDRLNIKDGQRKGTDIESVTRPSQRHIPNRNLVPYVRLEPVTLDRLNIKTEGTEIVGSSNKRSYCEICKKYFTRYNYLNEHNERLHSDQTIPKETFKCDNCSEEFARKNLLRSHIQSIHLPPLSKSKKFTCDHCGWSFWNKRNLIMHLESLKNQRYYCNICGKGSASEYSLSDHKRRVHSSQPRRSQPSQHCYCDICGKQLSSKYKLAIHVRIVHIPEDKKNVVPCDECHKQFSCIKYMLKHNKQVHDNKRLICADCSAVFATKAGLILHIQKQHSANSSTINPREATCKCFVCSKVLFTKNSLNLHLYSKHNITAGTGTVKFFDCSVCGKRFIQKYKCIRHQRVHSEEKPFACKECGKSFRNESNLLQHSRTHSDTRPFECNVCQMGFRFKHHLQQHAATHKTKQKRSSSKSPKR